ncbi:MAG: 3-hydroxyanthranilate 3,4-dioxygenase [Gemmataceae bacterium]|nr:3-hydroxyanthranilate 3,4-dioxygenase [Gemmataceae bacterium]
MSQLAPLNLNQWIEDNRHLLKPPVGNACIWNSGFLVMIVGGPNARTDFHINPGEELFYQIEGDIVLKIMENGKPRDILIKKGEMFLLPAKVPHSPRRPANTIGLVVEQPKASPENQHLCWYCLNCNAVLHDAEFQVVDIGKQIKAAIDHFKSDDSLQTCKACGTRFPA